METRRVRGVRPEVVGEKKKKTDALVGLLLAGRLSGRFLRSAQRNGFPFALGPADCGRGCVTQ